MTEFEKGRAVGLEEAARSVENGDDAEHHDEPGRTEQILAAQVRALAPMPSGFRAVPVATLKEWKRELEDGKRSRTYEALCVLVSNEPTKPTVVTPRQGWDAKGNPL